MMPFFLSHAFVAVLMMIDDKSGEQSDLVCNTSLSA